MYACGCVRLRLCTLLIVYACRFIFANRKQVAHNLVNCGCSLNMYEDMQADPPLYLTLWRAMLALINAVYLHLRATREYVVLICSFVTHNVVKKLLFI